MRFLKIVISCGLLCLVLVANAQPRCGPEMRIGFAPARSMVRVYNVEQMITRSLKRDFRFDFVSFYVPLAEKAWDTDNVKSALRQGYDIFVVATFHGASAADIASGKHDAQLRRFAQVLMTLPARDGQIAVRILHESNGWYAWSVAKNHRADIQRAWAHVIALLRETVGTHVRIDYNVTRKSARGGAKTIVALYPGDDVEVCSTTSFNRVGSSKWHKTPHGFWEEAKSSHDALAKVCGNKPLYVGEVSTMPFVRADGTPGKPEWFRQLAEDVCTQSRFDGVTFFLRDKLLPDADVILKWGIHNDAELAGLADAIAHLKNWDVRAASDGIYTDNVPVVVALRYFFTRFLGALLGFGGK